MHCLRLHCLDQPGIVAAVAAALADSQCNIEESAQFHDPFSGHFFMRVEYAGLAEDSHQIFRKHFQQVAARFNMQWEVNALGIPAKTLILVSKEDHCLNDLLYRWRTRHLNIDIVGVASNHENAHPLVASHGLPFHHVSAPKTLQEERIEQIAMETGAELIVLARYMQILSEGLCKKFSGRIINIHHSFLPGFKGAKPYHQAYERGVKIIGATAHFATADLDEGPIIAQQTAHINHALTPKKMQALGRDTESIVLARAVQLFTERRIFLHGKRTVIL